MPETVFIFDLGKVLLDFDYSIAARKIAARSSRAPKDMHAFLGGSTLLLDYESGRMTKESFFQTIRDGVGFQGDLLEFSTYFADIFTEITEMTTLNSDLRRLGYKTYIFSNTNDLAMEHVEGVFPFFDHFDGYIYSYEVGAMKPHPKIYEAMEQMCGHRGADLVYIDDRPENIAAGAARGWRSILHVTPSQTIAALGHYGLLAD